MIVIAEPYARFSQTLELVELRARAPIVLELAEEIVFSHRDYARLAELGPSAIRVSVHLEEGSTKAKATVKAIVGVLVLYGGLRQTADYLVRDAKAVGHAIVMQLPSAMGLPSEPDRREFRAGQVGQLKRLFDKVARGEVSSEDATEQAIRMLQRCEAGELPRELADQLSAEMLAADSGARQ